MKILYYHQHFSTPAGSTGTRSYEMARKLIARGHQVTMVCGSYQDGHTGLENEFIGKMRQGTVDGIQVIEFALPYANKDSFSKRSLTFLRFALKSIWLALRAQYDLVFATSTPLTAGLPGIAARWLRRKPFVFEVRDLWPDLPREMGVIANPFILTALEWLEWCSYHSATACIGLSPGIVQGIIRRGIPSERVAMIPNGCDLELFASETVNKAALRVGEPGKFTVMFTGAHGIANGLDAVLDAAHELLRRSRDDIQLVFLGNGKLKPLLQQRAHNDSLTNCIFLEPVPKTTLAQLMNRVDAGLMILANVPAFYYGTSPNKFFDYIAAGLPAIINYPGWLADIITESQGGVVVPPGDPVAFADALEFLADHPKERKQMGHNARMLAERCFDRNDLATQLVDWIEHVAGNNR